MPTKNWTTEEAHASSIGFMGTGHCQPRSLPTYKDAIDASYIYGEIGDYQCRSGETTIDISRPNGYLWKRESGHVDAKSLERMRRESS